jgi:DNA-binding IscR family transcriptional regulator
VTSNTRFAVGLHILALLAGSREIPVTSDSIGNSVNTNPVVIRRVLGDLRRARLVSAQGGNGGGWRLGRDAHDITLADVYGAVQGETLFPLHRKPPNPECPVGRHIQQVLTERFDAAGVALRAELARTSVADIWHGIANGSEPAPHSTAGVVE